MTASVYTPHVDSALSDGWSLDPKQALPDELLGLSPAEIEEERGRYQILLINAASEQDAAIYQHKLDHIERAIERYRKHPIGIRWPDRSRFNKLVDVAQDLKRAVPLDRFIAETVMTTRLERGGGCWKGHCPISDHDDKTPSFIVYPNDGWKCFGCDRGGDIYTLIGLVFGLERFRDQVALLADFYGRGLS